MSEKMMWGYMLYLSNHIGADEYTPRMRYNPPACPGYSDEINTQIDIWDKLVPFLAERKYNMVLIDVGDGIKYESHPEVSAPNAWEKDFLRQKLAELRALGIEPIPKLNFSTCHDTWMKKYRRMVSSPEYYTFCSDVIREVCEVFDFPRLFHIGFDEEDLTMQTTKEMVIIRNTELWWHDLFFICKECEKHGARPWMWSDYLWKNEEIFLQRMSKSILQSNWFYPQFQDWSKTKFPHRNKCIETYEILDRNGFDQVPTGSTWNHYVNLYQTVAYGKDVLNPDQLKGFLCAPWLATRDEHYYGHLNAADRLYRARQKVYHETLK
ncbi:MAG: Tat pathway signal protein [Ruminococcaceae bacterium]|nr:Tat pathway signal protein [Oscillospiraceae bacterium]